MYIGSVADHFAVPHLPRQQLVNCTRDADGFLDEDTCIVPFWHTRTGAIVKWSVFLGLTTLFGLYVILGYTHAKSRIKKGLKPLAYHRWLVPRAMLARVDPAYAYAARPAGFHYYGPDQYGMQPMPPPVYDPNAPHPPMYPGGGMPDGATKADPSQWRTEPTRRPAESQQEGANFAAPPGPPPTHLPPEGSGTGNPFRL